MKVPLLIRYGRRVRLTPEARILLGQLDSIETELERARAELEALGLGQAGPELQAAILALRAELDAK